MLDSFLTFCGVGAVCGSLPTYLGRGFGLILFMFWMVVRDVLCMCWGLVGLTYCLLYYIMVSIYMVYIYIGILKKYCCKLSEMKMIMKS